MTTDLMDNLNTEISIATDKVTTITTDSSITSTKAVRSDDDDRSVELRTTGVNLEEPAEITFDTSGPLRVNTAKLGLNSSLSSLEIPRKLEKEVGKKMRRRKSDSASGGHMSGSRSPMYDGGSSISSLEEMGIDADLLTDKMGMLELDFKEQQEQTDRLNKSLSNLPPVSERLSEETLEDVHAFTNVKREDGYTSRGNSITTGGEVSSNVLEPLDEGDEEEENEGGKVKITNMEEILEAPDEDLHA